MALQYLGTTISALASDTKPALSPSGSDPLITANEKGVILIETDTNKLFQWDGDSWNELTSVGVLDSGSITSNFGNINIGSSTITTTGAITAGSLTVSGTTTTVNSTTLAVDDPLISMATNQTSGTNTDAVDMGFYGAYRVGGVTKYRGLAYDIDTARWKLFQTTGDNNTAPTTTVPTGTSGGDTFTYGDIQANNLYGANLILGGTTLSVSAAELNIMDGNTSASSTALADADRIVVNDAGTMKQVALTDFETYFETVLDTLSAVTTVGDLASGSIASGFGTISTGNAITTTGALSGGTLTTSGLVSASDSIRITGATTLTGLDALELSFNPSASPAAQGQVGAYDRTNSDYLPLYYYASKHMLNVSGTNKVVLDSSGLTVSSETRINDKTTIGDTAIPSSDNYRLTLHHTDAHCYLSFQHDASPNYGVTGTDIGVLSSGIFALAQRESQPVRVDIAGQTKFQIDGTTGYIGMGTITPDVNLDVEKDGGGGTVAMKISNTGTAANDVAYLELKTAGNAHGTYTAPHVRYTHGGGTHNWYTGLDLTQYEADTFFIGAGTTVGSTYAVAISRQTSRNVPGFRIDPADFTSSGTTSDVGTYTFRTLAHNVTWNDNPGTNNAARWQINYMGGGTMANSHSAQTFGSSMGATTLHLIPPSAGSNITFTHASGIHIANQTSAGTTTNLYGLKIDSISGGTNDFSIHTGTAQSVFHGNVGIKIDAPTEALHVTGNILATANITAYSDARLKENITTIDSALDKVTKMRGVTYDRIDIDHHGAGVLAQELEAVAPELVRDGEYKSVAYGNLTAYLVEAIKELKDEIAELKNGDK